VPNGYFLSADIKESPGRILWPLAVTPSEYLPQHLRHGQYEVTRIRMVCHSPEPSSSEFPKRFISRLVIPSEAMSGSGAGLFGPASLSSAFITGSLEVGWLTVPVSMTVVLSELILLLAFA
jgi:hypothetical protein